MTKIFLCLLLIYTQTHPYLASPNQPTPNNSRSSSTIVPFNHSLCRFKRQKFRLEKFNDFHIEYTSAITTHQLGIRYPLSYVLSYDKISHSYHNFVMSISFQTEPKSYTKASKFDHWIQAMHDEITTKERNNT